MKSPDVYLKSLEAISFWRKGTNTGLIRFGELAQEIVDMAPDSPSGYILLGWYYIDLANIGRSPRESMTKAFELAQKAIALDDTVAYPYTLLAIIYTVMRKHEKAIAAGERGVALNPSGAGSHAMLGSALGYAGRLDEDLYHIKQGIRLDPFPDYMFVFHLGRVYM